MPGIRAFGSCPAPQFSGGGIALQSTGAKVARGQTARWQATAPTGLQIVAAGVPSSLVVAGVNDGSQYGGGFYWSGGGASVKDAQSGALLGGFSSPYFGVQLICGVSSCTSGENQIDIGEIVLSVRETSGLKIVAPDDLWQANGWLRGNWVLHYTADAPSGVCGLGASLNGQPIEGSLSGQNVAVWHQCAAPAVSKTIDLDRYGQGPVALTLEATDAAGNSGAVTKTVDVDPTSPTLTLSGPSDAPSTAGTQFVTANAGGSPSGIAGISCGVDGAPSHWYPGSPAQVPVSGVGDHAVDCAAENNAVDDAGNHGWSATQTRTLSIRIPTINGIAFSRIVDALSCHRSSELVRVPAHWVKVRQHHRLVRVKVGASVGTIERTRCHPRTARRSVTIWVTARRRGKNVRVKRRVLKRVVLVPHLISRATRQVAHGHRATVDGWLGTSAGIALPNQPVWILTAADNGLGRFRLAAATTTASNGSWLARLPAGPSRLVEAVYPGGRPQSLQPQVRSMSSSRRKSSFSTSRPVRLRGEGPFESPGCLPAGICRRPAHSYA